MDDNKFKLTPEDLISEIITPPIGTDVYHYVIPTDESRIYDIDLTTRTIKLPTHIESKNEATGKIERTPYFLSVVEDHNASVLWFRVDRFYDDIDLYGASCWIQYRNSLKEEFICMTYPKPYVHDTHEYLYLPWPVTQAVTAGDGVVEFSFRFFKLSENVDEVIKLENGEEQEVRKVIFSLNTRPATGKILNTLQVGPYSGFLEEDSDLNESDFLPERKELLIQLENLLAAVTRLNNDYTLYWREVE